MIARLVSVAGAALVVLGFFLPWLDGAGEFIARDFSGFDLARLVRNFEIARGGEEGGLRATAVALYAVPALAINGAVLTLLPITSRTRGAALCVSAGYGLTVLIAAAALSAVSWTELERVLGGFMLGWFVTLAGVIVLGATGVLALRWDRGTTEAVVLVRDG